MWKATAIAALLLLGGCWNGENIHLELGDVSLGQQLMDLKAALESEAMTEEEYASAKERLLTLSSLCDNTEAEGD